MIPFEELTDLIVEIDIDGTKTYCQSPELIKAGKEQYKREKDLLGLFFCGKDIYSYKSNIHKFHSM